MTEQPALKFSESEPKETHKKKVASNQVCDAKKPFFTQNFNAGCPETSQERSLRYFSRPSMRVRATFGHPRHDSGPERGRRLREHVVAEVEKDVSEY